LKSNYIIHAVAAFTLGLGIWLFLGDSSSPPENKAPAAKFRPDSATDTASTLKGSVSGKQLTAPMVSESDSRFREHSKAEPSQDKTFQEDTDPESVINNYMAAWRNNDKQLLAALWESIAACEPCLQQLVDMVVNKTLERGMLLETAIKMAALNTDTVLPVFDALIDPAGDSSTAIILAEKVINNGRPEFVTRIFDVIYRAQQNGYTDFARQMTWVISKLDNHAGLAPILDTIAGRSSTTRDFSGHVSNVLKRVIANMPDSDGVATIMADYYRSANAQEQRQLMEVISHHPDTLVLLAADADRNGQNYDVRRYANAIARLPNLRATEGLLKLHSAVEYAPDYLPGLLVKKVQGNPNIKVLQKLEDYMRDPNMDLDTRLLAAEGLLSVKDNRHARYMLEKVINNNQYANPDLQAYIGGRM
jgi:hypothetical protein